jgi:hypothetical protein
MTLVAIEEGPLPLMFEDALKNGKIQSASAKLARLLKNHKKPDGERLKPHTIRIRNQTPKGFTETISRRRGDATFLLTQKKPQRAQQAPHTIEGMLRLWRLLSIRARSRKTKRI